MEVNDARRTFGRGRRVLIGLNVTLMSVVAVLLAGGLAYLAQRPELRTRVDLTAEQAFTLSEQTINILGALEQPVRVVTLFAPNDFDRSTGLLILGFGELIGRVRDLTVDLLQEYRFSSRGLVELEILDYNNPRDFRRIEEVRREYKVQANSVLLVCENRRKVLGLDDLATIDRGSYYQGDPRPPKLIDYKGEEAITSALSAVVQEGSPVLYELQGHGEKRLESGGLAGLDGFLFNLQNNNILVKPLSLAGGMDVPEDASVLLLVAPEKEIPAEETGAVRRYLEGGGRLFAALEPRNPRALQDLLFSLYGVFLETGIVCEERSRAGGVDPEKTKLYIQDRYGADAPAVSYHRSRQLLTVFLDAGSIGYRAEPPPGVQLKPLLWTDEDAWLDPLQPPVELPGAAGERTFDPPGEQKRPRTLGLQAEGGDGARGSRLVLMADSDFLANAFRGYPGNGDLAVNCVEWLTGRESRIGISPRSYRTRKVDLTPSEYDAIFIYTVMLMPGAAVVLGIVVWWMRRR
ncbi:MAG: GldG family protein [Planctomycetota bacterium]